MAPEERFRSDLAAAQADVVILSPFLSPNRALHYYPAFGAVRARGADPGPWVQQWERRPDLATAKRARVAKIIAERDGPERAEEPAWQLRRVG